MIQLLDFIIGSFPDMDDIKSSHNQSCIDYNPVKKNGSV